MLEAFATITKAVAPIFQWAVQAFGLRKAKKEGMAEAIRKEEERLRIRAGALAEKRRRLEREAEERLKDEKRKVAIHGPGSAKERMKALGRKVSWGKKD